jgi:NAD(P)-dependent dehydrogenase (short-subunit alcohol dehydrogenase family)
VALITGGDSGIGRAVAIAYAMEGADVAIFYNQHDEDAEDTQALVEAKGKQCLMQLIKCVKTVLKMLPKNSFTKR